MTTHVLLVQMAVAPGSEAAYRRWHDRHLVELATHVPGLSRAKRMELDPAGTPVPEPDAAFAALYELEGDPAVVLAALEVAKTDGLVSPPPDGVVIAARRVLYAVADAPQQRRM